MRTGLDAREHGAQGAGSLFPHGAGTIPTATGLGHPYWAMVSAVAAVSGVDAGARLVRAGHRMLGTIVGVLIAAALLAAPLPPLAVIAVVVLLQMSAELVVGRNYGITQRHRQPRVRTGTSTARYCSPCRRPLRGGREWRAPRRNHSF